MINLLNYEAMNRIKVNFNKVPIPEKIQRAYGIFNAMSGNPNFPSPAPGMEELAGTIKALEDYYVQSSYGDRQKRAIMRLCERELDQTVNWLANYVNNECRGDLEKILSSGFDVYKPR